VEQPLEEQRHLPRDKRTSASSVRNLSNKPSYANGDKDVLIIKVIFYRVSVTIVPYKI
jgi:hypothetical protein